MKKKNKNVRATISHQGKTHNTNVELLLTDYQENNKKLRKRRYTNVEVALLENTENNKNTNWTDLVSANAITLITLVITIVILIILASVTINFTLNDNGLFSKTKQAKIITIIGTLKEEIQLEKLKIGETGVTSSTVEQLLTEGKVKRTVQQDGENYYIYYGIVSGAYDGMQNLGKGTIASLKDVFLIDDDFNIKYIDSKGNEYGDDLNNKLLEDETEIKFSSKAFSEFVSKISGITEDEMKFKWMKNLTSLEITDSSIDSLEDLVFFPNLTYITLGGWGGIELPNLKSLNGIENCSKLQTLYMLGYNGIEDYSALGELSNLEKLYCSGIGGKTRNDFNKIVEALKSCNNIKDVTLNSMNIDNMSKISNLSNLTSLNLVNNKITKIEGLDNLSNLTSLSLSGNKITKIEGLEKLTNLDTLDLYNNQINDITPLSANSISLTSLDLRKNADIKGKRSDYTEAELEKIDKIGTILNKDNGKIQININQLGLFTGYKSLDLGKQNLTTLESLEGLTELTYLNLESNNITLEDEKSQEILKSMTKLQNLNMNNNGIVNLKPINYLTNLNTLQISGSGQDCNLKDIEDIISQVTLRVNENLFNTILNCDKEKITKITLNLPSLSKLPDLSYMTYLEKFSINSCYNDIENLGVISNVKSLKKLELHSIGSGLHEKMIDFSQLTNLTYLSLRGNKLWSDDLENLKVLKNNKNLEIHLENNSIVDASALLELDTSCKIYLSGNVNLTQESKDALKARFGSNVSF